jgi:hypothetical protein
MSEFENVSKIKTALICLKYEFQNWWIQTGKRMLGRKIHRFDIKRRYSVWAAKRIVMDENLAIVDNSHPSWFYSAFDRNDADPLTNYSLKYIEQNVPKEASILIMGCGTGIMAFHLADAGFINIEGRDLLEKCIRVANRLGDQFGYKSVKFHVDDGFQPKLKHKYDLITAMHWVFSAWMGNYGNTPPEDAYNPLVREHLLSEFLGNYVEHLSKNGLIIVELIDAVADYRDPFDHPLGQESTKIYPVRHTPEQVRACASKLGLEVIDKRLCVNYSHQPRTSYILRKT